MPGELYQKIIEFLKSIPNIDNLDTRKALVLTAGLDTELQQQLDFTGSPAQFVPKFVSTLCDYGILKDRRYALEAILEAAKKLVGQDRKDRSDKLIQELKRQNKRNIIPIPILIVAMRKNEAEKLFNSTPEQEGFLAFQQVKPKFCLEDMQEWLAHYSEDRIGWKPYISIDRTIHSILLEDLPPHDDEDINWRPYLASDKTIHFIISNVFNDINGRNGSNLNIIKPIFETTDEFFDEHHQHRRNAICNRLTDLGGIVIVDSISLFHPKIYEVLENKNIKPKNATIIAIPPLSKQALEINALIGERIYACMGSAFYQFAKKKFEDPVEFGISHPCVIERWLFKVLQEFATPQKLQKFPKDKPPGFQNPSSVIFGRF